MAESRLEYQTIVNCSKYLEVALQSDRGIVHFLNCEGFITQEVCDDVLNPRSTLTHAQKAGELVTGIRNMVSLSPKRYTELVEHLCQNKKRYGGIVEILSKEYQKLQHEPDTSRDEEPLPRAKLTHICNAHRKELDLYCETCCELICSYCAIKGGMHQQHKYQLLTNAFDEYRVEILSSLEPVEKELVNTNIALVQLDAFDDEIAGQQAQIEANVHEEIEQLLSTIKARESALIKQLRELADEKRKRLAAQRKQIKIAQTQLSSFVERVRGNLRTGNQEELLKMKSKMIERVNELTTSFQPDILKPDVKADMRISFTADAATACANHGTISISVVQESDVTPEKLTVVGKTSTAIVSCDDGSLECELVSEITGTRGKCSMQKRGRNQYEISYQPTVKGKHHLQITQHIKESVAANLPVEKLGTPIQIIDTVETPWGIALNSKTGEVVVSEENCVSVFSPNGQKQRSFGELIGLARGVAVDSEGNIVVADRYHHYVHQFSTEGLFLNSKCEDVTAVPLFNNPAGIAFNSYNQKLYIGDANDRIQVLNSNFTFHSTFGNTGKGKGQFKDPCAIACDSTGKVYVVDSKNNRIQVFTAEGKFVRMFGKCGQGRGELSYPIGIAVDGRNRVYVSEQNTSRVSVFTSGGLFVTSFGKKGEELGDFNEPRGIAVDSNGVVYVCDKSNNRIQVF